MSKFWLFALVGCAMRLHAALNDSAPTADTIYQPIVLVVKGNSYLENAVTKIIADRLSQQGISVKQIALTKLPKENYGAYRAILIFHAIQASGLLDPIARDFIASKSSSPSSNIMICTVFGEKWQGKKSSVDAVSAATKTFNPEMVAQKILINVLKEALGPDSNEIGNKRNPNPKK